MRRKQPPGKGNGFSLVELLIVIAIIVLLVGIIMPSLLKARQTVKGTVCAMNERNLALGMVQYLASTGARRFPSPYVWHNPLWFDVDDLQCRAGSGLAPKNTFRCPGHASADWPLPSGKYYTPAIGVASSYAMQYWLDHARPGGDGTQDMFGRIGEFHQNPANVILFGETSGLMYCPAWPDTCRSPKFRPMYFPTERHGNRLNYIMFDLSVRTLEAPREDDLQVCSPPGLLSCMYPTTGTPLPHWCYYNRYRITYIDECVGSAADPWASNTLQQRWRHRLARSGLDPEHPWYPSGQGIPGL